MCLLACSTHFHDFPTMRSLSRPVLWLVLGLLVTLGLAIPALRFGDPSRYAQIRTPLLVSIVAAAALWFLGRPLLVLVTDRRRGPVPPGSRTGVSIVVPCSNVADRLEAMVENLLEQTYRPLEIVLVENNSRDATWELMGQLAHRHREVTALSVDVEPDEYACSVAINVGISHARYSVILRMDDDTRLRADAVATAIAEMQAVRAVGVACNLRVSNPHQSIWTRLQSIEYLLAMDIDRRTQALFDSVVCCSGGMSMFRKDLLIEVGGFVSAPTLVSEDLDMTLKAHRFGRVAIAPEAIGFTEVPSSLRRLALQRFRWAISGTVSTYLHRRGIANARYWHHPAVGFIGLPMRVLLVARDLLAPIFLLDIYLLLSNDGPSWFAALFGLRMLVLSCELLLLTPALNRRDARQGLDGWWLIPAFVLLYGPLLLVLRWLGTWAGLSHVVELNARRDVVLARGLLTSPT